MTTRIRLRLQAMLLIVFAVFVAFPGVSFGDAKGDFLSKIKDVTKDLNEKVKDFDQKSDDLYKQLEPFSKPPSDAKKIDDVVKESTSKYADMQGKLDSSLDKAKDKCGEPSKAKADAKQKSFTGIDKELGDYEKAYGAAKQRYGYTLAQDSRFEDLMKKIAAAKASVEKLGKFPPPDAWLSANETKNDAATVAIRCPSRDKCLAPGTCTRSEADGMQSKKNSLCNQKRSCSAFKIKPPADPKNIKANEKVDCGEMSRLIEVGADCRDQRTKIMHDCFRDGNQAHLDERAEVQAVIDDCQDRLKSAKALKICK
ncbi:MAG: hypothetical protein ABI193_09385 [Minicystis sp.]